MAGTRIGGGPEEGQGGTEVGPGIGIGGGTGEMGGDPSGWINMDLLPGLTTGSLWRTCPAGSAGRTSRTS